MDRCFRLSICQLSVLLFITLTFPAFAQEKVVADAWEHVKREGQGTVTVYWHESRPYVYRTSLGMQGIEYEMMEDFRQYLKENHHIDLHIIWKEAESFGDTYDRICTNGKNGTFGLSAFSVTPEREKDVQFSAPYMSDISVLITSKGIPIVQTYSELNAVFSKLTAITIEATTFEQDVLRLKHEGDLPFDIEYIPSSANILHAVEARDSAFAFIDLPVYLMMFNEDPSLNVKRQNLYPIRRKGYAFIHPQQSDWGEPLQAYFSSDRFAYSKEEIVGRYIDIDLYHFVESFAIQSNDMVVLLTKEKEIQYKDLLGKAQQIAREARTRNFLIVLIAVIFISLIIIIVLYRKRNEQKKRIELQQKSIELKNEQLEKRNHQLVTLDEEKNNLIKILAHDLRTPINHVQGLAEVLLLSNDSLSEEQKEIIQRINEAAIRLSKMITNILDIDSLENNQVKVLMDEVHVSPLLQQVVRSFDKQAERKNIGLSVELTAENTSIKGDPLFLTQIFENLISNAMKFSEKGKHVEIRTRESGGYIHISVKDTGPGLSAEDMDLVFKKFQRLSARPTGGEASTGLGLSIVKKYVELMDGKVWCESEPGKGANFILEFRKLA